MGTVISPSPTAARRALVTLLRRTSDSRARLSSAARSCIALPNYHTQGCTMRCSLFVAVALAVTGCPRHPILPDGGDEDAGNDGGFDAGRPKGADPASGYSIAVAQAACDGGMNKLGVGLAMLLDQNEQPVLAYVHEDPNDDG